MAAKERSIFFDGIEVLEITMESEQLAEMLLQRVPLPANADIDALHITTAALNGMTFLLTWDCKHIANPPNFRPPYICTPLELIEVDNAR
jgi:hypothetical protein